MKFNKLKAFTLAEVLVLLLTLSILMAAFAPVFTRRYNNVTTDEVWTFIAGDTEKNAYFDAPNKIYLNQAFIGLQPRDTSGVDDLVKDGANAQLYSKVVIGASNNIDKSGKPQQQMQFRYGSSASGVLAATLFAGNKNMLLGGPYSDIKNIAEGQNSAFGVGTLKKLTEAKNNTAVGYNALSSITKGRDNTAIGYRAGSSIDEGYGNTFIGYNAGAETSNTIAYNTLVGLDAGKKIQGSYNTIIGNYALSSSGSQFGNTAIGYQALKNATGNYNTAVGAYSLMNMKGGSYNTAIGYNSCNFIGYSSSSPISKVTCIGANSAKEDKSGSSGGAGLPTGENVPDRVFIGTSTRATNSTISSNNQQAFAVLEVHNSLNNPNNSLMPNPGGDESVIINGNLVVRGQPYFETKVFRAAQPGSDYGKHVPKGLMLYKLYNHYQLGNSSQVLAGYDGIHRVAASYEGCRGCKQHKFNNIRTNCICTAVGPSYNGNTSYTNYSGTSATRYSSTSYDWYSSVSGSNGIGGCVSGAATYNDKSTGNTITLSYSPRGASGTSGMKEWQSREVDNPQSHYGADNLSCCPILTSDVRLKNVGEKFTAGLDEIKRLNVYNYTFKNDKNRLPRVGVIAQDLKIVFPNAVFKGQDGFYRIRWDEMLYAAINAVKTLNSKVVSLANKVAADKERVATLKRDNAQMYAQLDKLARELEVLEAEKK